MKDSSASDRHPDLLRADLLQFDQKIELLTQQIAQLSAEDLEEASTYQSYLDALHVKRKAVELKLEQLNETDDTLLEDLQAGMEDVWQDFKMTFTRASEEFEAGQRLRESRQKPDS
ncbi:MAG: hypothetical protein ACFB4J_01680 [Elainellaceae cyanobacterium]